MFLAMVVKKTFVVALMLTAFFGQVASRIAVLNVSRVNDINGSSMMMFHENFLDEKHLNGSNDDHVNVRNESLKSISSSIVESDGKEAAGANLTVSVDVAFTVVNCIPIVNFTDDINEDLNNATDCKTKSSYKICELLIVTASGLSLSVIITVVCYFHCFKTFQRRMRMQKESKGSKKPVKEKYSLCGSVLESVTVDDVKSVKPPSLSK
ncbi:Green-sensitive opsin-2 [Trichinella spiralis]|uniref:Green-sensitive opsin-2 n=1 Tax=Trichinella spiralis TaxID=6334 RepID=A0ABR3KZQ1_TRISP